MTTHTDTATGQLVLPGQAAAPPGPVDMTVMYVMHYGFRTDLERFAEAARSTPSTDREAWTALARRWTVFASVLHHHHSGEDAGLWPWLLAHGDAGDRETLLAMEAEHADIDPALEACRDGFARLAEHADDDARAALAERLAGTRDQLARHLRHEEQDAIAIVQRLMTQEEWKDLEEEHWNRGVTVRMALALVPWALHRLPEDVRARVLPDAPVPFRVVWLLTRRRFARREARTFRHVA